MRRVILSMIFSFFFISISYAGPCMTTVTAALSSALTCSDDDILNITSTGSISYGDHKTVDLEDESGVQITNNGTIETEDESEKQKPIHAQSSLDTIITNNGTINSDNNEAIYLDYAENVTITNNAGATISAEGEQALEGRNIGWCDRPGNKSDCQSSLSDSGSTGVGLKLYNYGTISSTKETIYLGKGGSSKQSRNIRIYNYDGGNIKTTSGMTAIIGRHVEDIEIINYEGATIEGAGRYGLDFENGTNITIDNKGTLKSGAQNAIWCRQCSDVTFTNSGTITSTFRTLIFDRQPNGEPGNTITNSGTITATDSQDALSISRNDNNTITNSGTISGVSAGITAGSISDTTITNSGTITATGDSGKGINYGIDGSNTPENNILNNSGTISGPNGTAAGIAIGKNESNPFNNLTINNSGTILGADDSIRLISSQATGIDIVTKSEGTYEGEIDLNSTATTMTLDCSITKDQKIEIHNKTNMVITNNLCGNDTYEILDSNSDADADNSETNGFLYVYGEDLDIDSHNKKYRTEIFLSNLIDIFNSVSEENKSSGYYSVKKRNNVYKNETTGISGDFNIENNNFIPFLSYSSQQAKFNNGEALDSENLGLGLKKEIDYEKFKFSIIPIVGLTNNKFLDLETETKQKILKENFGQFAAVNLKTSKKVEIDDSQSLKLEVDGKYGLKMLPTYLSSFTDGDLSVDDAVDQVLSGGFNIEYSKFFENGFVLKPYTGLSLNHTLSSKIDIVADGERKDKIHFMDKDLAKRVGLNISKNNDSVGLNFNIELNDQNGLKDSQVKISLTKKIQSNINKRIEGLPIDPELEKLFDQLQLAKQNERLAEIAGRTVEENKIMRELIIKLIKENQKLKTENLLLNN